jgi:hypothetical protein
MDLIVTEETTQVLAQENSTIVQVQEAATLTLSATEETTVLEVAEPQTTVIEVGIQGPAGPAGNAVFVSAQVDSAAIKGQPLYLKQTGTLDLAAASQLPRVRVCGLAARDAAAFTAVDYDSDGVIERSDWTAICGTSSLTPGAYYYLSLEPGELSTIAPTTGYVTRVGQALSATKLAIELNSPIRL